MPGSKIVVFSPITDSAARMDVAMQVHVMVMTRGHDYSLMRTLHRAAISLSPLAATYSPVSQPLLPEAIKLGSQEAAQPTQHAPAMRVNGNALAASSQGSLNRLSVVVLRRL